MLEVSDQPEIFPVLEKIFKPKIFLLTPLGGVGCLQSQNFQGRDTSGVMQSRTNSWNRERKTDFTQKNHFIFQLPSPQKVVSMGKWCYVLFINYLTNLRSSKSAQNII